MATSSPRPRSLEQGGALIVADLEAKDLLAVADLPEAKNSIIFNIRLSDDALREEQCRSNIFHIAPSSAMRADALAQYLIWKQWPKWFVLKGTAPSDQDYVAAVERAAGRFGGKIVEERDYKFDDGQPAHRFRPSANSDADARSHPRRTRARRRVGRRHRPSASANTCPTVTTIRGRWSAPKA